MDQTIRRSLAAISVFALAGVVACSAPDPGASTSNTGSGASSGDGDGQITIGNGSGLPGTGMSDDPRVDLGVPVRTQTCDDQGNCTCLSLALLGTLNSAATDTDTSAFVNWLNDNSGGTATVTMVNQKPTLDAAFLAQYDVLIVANINAWVFSDAEKQAVAEWSANGGGIVNLTGFESTVSESAASSQLISFAGMGYSGTSSGEYAANNGQAVPVYYQGGTTDLKNCLSQWSQSGNAQITTPIHFTPQSGTLEDLTFSLDYVGAFIGWGVAHPADATVIATDPTSGRDMAVTYEYQQKGRIFAFGDEWVIFANQWAPGGTPTNQQMDEYNPCYIPPGSAPTEETFHSVKTLYQTKQFWYNAITWVAPPNECNFEITDSDVIIR